MLAVIATPSLAKTKVFGELSASYDKIFTVGADSRDNLALNNSIFGFKGATQIKSDVSFIYQFSWGVSVHDSGNNDFEGSSHSGFDNRNQVIGVASPVGAFVVGRFDTPFKTLGRKADLFWGSQLGQNRNISNAQDWDLRADKIIVLQSPKINGFQGSIGYASDISDTSRITQNASAVSLNGFYKKGKFLLGAAYEHHDLKISTINAKANALRLSGIYTDGPLKLVGFYQNEDNDFSVTSKPDAEVFGLGLAYKIGKGTLKTQVYTRNTDSSENSSLITAGYDYRLTQQLDVYAQAAKIENSKSLNGYDLGVNSTDLDDAHGISVGIRYKF